MKTTLKFIIENWPILAPILYEIVSRLWPTKWNVSLLDNLWKLINALMPNNRIPDGNESGLGTNAKGQVINKVTAKIGRHILRSLTILFLIGLFAWSSGGEARAQIWQNFKGIRLVNVFDSTTVLPINGTIFYNEQKTYPRFQVWENDTLKNLIGGGSGGNFWPLDGSATTSADVTIRPGIDSLGDNLNLNLGAPLGAGFSTMSFYGGQLIQATASDITLTANDDETITAQDLLTLNGNGSGGVVINGNSGTGGINNNVGTNTFTINTDKVLYSQTLGFRVKQTSTNQIFLAQNSSGGSVIDAIDGTIIFSGSGAQAINIEVGDEQRIQPNNPTASVETFNIKGANGNVTNINGDNLAISGGNGTAGQNGNAGSVQITSGTPTGSGTRGYVILPNLPTVSPCGTAPSGTLWSNSNVLTVCP